MRSRWCLMTSTVPSTDVGVLEGDAGDRLGRAAQVVGQPDEAQRVDELGCRDEVAEPSTGEGERLAHGPRHDEPRVVGQERQRGSGSGPGELGVGLVDDDDRVRRRVEHRTDDLERQRRAGRVVRRAEEDDRRVVLARLRRRRLRRQVERVGIGCGGTQPVDPRRAVRLA